MFNFHDKSWAPLPLPDHCLIQLRYTFNKKEYNIHKNDGVIKAQYNQQVFVGALALRLSFLKERFSHSDPKSDVDIVANMVRFIWIYYYTILNCFAQILSINSITQWFLLYYTI